MFATLKKELPSRIKIEMLRLFFECLDVSDPLADGWTVHGELKKSYNKEKVPVSQNAITWLMRATCDEQLVVFGSETIWTALQTAVRSFLVQERNYSVLYYLLGISPDSKDNLSASHVTAFSQWFALRASERELVPMVLDAGRFCQIRGFDWVEDDITPSQFIRALPVIYVAWSVAFPNGVDRVEDLVKLELDACLERLGWTTAGFLEILSTSSCQHDLPGAGNVATHRACSECGDCYGLEGYGLVQPARIQFTECIKTKHRLGCHCSVFLHNHAPVTTPPMEQDVQNDDDSDVDEEFFDVESEPAIKDIPDSIDAKPDPFWDAATMLYRAQGRTWLGSYGLKEILCATCWLRREKYIHEAGLGAEDDLPPMPEGYEMYRADIKDCTVETSSN